jgi:hypothetical protein
MYVVMNMQFVVANGFDTESINGTMHVLWSISLHQAFVYTIQSGDCLHKKVLDAVWVMPDHVSVSILLYLA